MPVVYVIKSFQNALRRNKQCCWGEEWATESCQDCPVIELGLEYAAALVCSSHWALFSSCKKIKAVIHPEDRVQESLPSKSTSTKVICFSCLPWLLFLEQGYVLHFYKYLWLITGIKTHWEILKKKKRPTFTYIALTELCSLSCALTNLFFLHQSQGQRDQRGEKGRSDPSPAGKCSSRCFECSENENFTKLIYQNVLLVDYQIIRSKEYRF